MDEALVSIQGVPASESDEWWPIIGDWIEKALAHGGGFFILEDAKAAVANRDMQLWVISVSDRLSAACLTTINKWPRASVLTAVAVGGFDMPTWVGPLTDLLDRFAKANGCAAVDCHGRRGWKKALEAQGWEEAMTTFSREVSHGR